MSILKDQSGAIESGLAQAQAEAAHLQITGQNHPVRNFYTEVAITKETPDQLAERYAPVILGCFKTASHESSPMSMLLRGAISTNRGIEFFHALIEQMHRKLPALDFSDAEFTLALRDFWRKTYEQYPDNHFHPMNQFCELLVKNSIRRPDLAYRLSADTVCPPLYQRLRKLGFQVPPDDGSRWQNPIALCVVLGAGHAPTMDQAAADLLEQMRADGLDLFATSRYGIDAVELSRIRGLDQIYRYLSTVKLTSGFSAGDGQQQAESGTHRPSMSAGL